VPSHDAAIDRLYALPLAEFTAARNALAKILPKDDAAAVKRLEKPTTVAWAVNQLYWRDRHAWTRLMKAGQALRAAQIAALKGGEADLRQASVSHRSALVHAMQRTVELAAPTAPAADQLTRMLEAISLAAEAPGPPGRYTDVVQPSGFEALAGVTPVGRAAPAARREQEEPPKRPQPDGRRTAAQRRAEEAAVEKARAAAQRAARDEVQRAATALEKARTAADRAARDVEEAAERLSRLQAERDRLHTQVDDARRQLERAQHALDALD
jgi:hypothetical protein